MEGRGRRDVEGGTWDKNIEMVGGTKKLGQNGASVKQTLTPNSIQ